MQRPAVPLMLTESAVVGAYAAMALDECTRAVFMFLRWNSGCWKNKNLLYQSEE